jgi:hypothetical protein
VHNRYLERVFLERVRAGGLTNRQRAVRASPGKALFSLHPSSGRMSTSRLHVVKGCVFGIIEFARIHGMSYGFGRIGTMLIPDNSKPTATWGRKAMGQGASSSAKKCAGRQVTEGIPL